MGRTKELRQQILQMVSAYYRSAFPARDFVPGVTPVLVSGRVFDADELVHLVGASLDFWLTHGPYAHSFESEFARFLGVRHAILCNSGSSANLLAVTTLTSRQLGEKRLAPGDEVITAAAGFPTTVNPIIQNGLVPVFIDIDIPTYNVDVTQLEDALSEKTRAIILAHTLGNPFDLEPVVEFARKHNLWLIEDCCDAVGATYCGRHVGTFGDLATVSFYPAHHITMGEGGCVLTRSPKLKTIVESFRDWGRDCWCEPGKENTCGKRFEWQLGDLPYGYDHKYVYSEIGYNLKATDLQAAIGLAQVRKLPEFIRLRRENFQFLRRELKELESYFILPEATAKAEPSWFGFPLLVRPDALFTRNEVVRYLEARNIATRLLFAGNLIRQPAYRTVRYRAVGDLARSDLVMRNLFWIGVYPGLSQDMLSYVVETLRQFCRERSGSG